MASGSTNQPRIQNTVPIVVGQIRSCKEQQFRLFGIPIQNVFLVGVLRKLEVESCNISCQLQDHSGSIKAIMRLESDNEIPIKLNGVKENFYVKIFGTVRNQDNERIIVILKILPVNDMNVITNHLLQVAAFSFEAEAERKKQIASANTCGAALADSLITSEEAPEGVSGFSASLNQFQTLIYDIVRSEHSDIGISRRNILRQFPSYQAHEVNYVLDYLISEGIIYCSIDQEHLKATTLN